MLNLETKLILDAATIEAANLTDKFTAADLGRIGDWVWSGFDQDKQSRSKWEQRTEAAMDLAMQIQKDKNFPWQGCSNINFPLVTIAITQFHARAYPAIINGSEVVKYEVVGSDPKGVEMGRAERIGMHMSWQLMKQSSTWESQQDRLLINLPTVGCAFKKTYNSGMRGKNESDLVMAKDLVLNYYAKSVEDCPRKTHVIPLYRNEIYTRVKTGLFRDILEEAWYKTPIAPESTTQNRNADNRAGITPPSPDEITPRNFLEQHCNLDLDQDGYAEPYIITVDQDSKWPVRIVCRFEQVADIQRTVDGDVICIKAVEYFTKYTFIPSPDGGIYDVGFGVLLGPLNEGTNSLINQITDAGTMSNAAGGFLGRGAKLRGGVYTFSPFGWQRVDSTGDDLRKNIFPLPVREPSQVLFSLLSLLIQYTNRISGSTDIMVGESVGQNTPADTARQMQAEGQKIYNAIFKRVWTSMKEEFRKLYILNAYHMPDTMSFGIDGKNVTRQDYLGDPTRVCPVADPNVTTQGDRIAQATALKQNAMQTPGYNGPEIEKLWLKAMGIPNIDIIYDPQKFPPGEDIKIQLKKLDLQGIQMKIQSEDQRHVMEMQSEYMLNQAKVNEMESHAASMMAGVQGEEMGRQLEHFKAMVEVMKSRNDMLMQMIQHKTKLIESRMKEIDLAGTMVQHEGKLVDHAGKIVDHHTKKMELSNARQNAN